MFFYRSKDKLKHIATDKNRCAIVTETSSGTTVSTFKFPFINVTGELYEECTSAEFYSAYDNVTDFMTSLAEIKPTNGKGVRILLPEAPESYK